MSNTVHGGEWTFEWLTRWDEVWADSFQSQWKVWMEQSANSHVFFEPPIVRAWYDTYMLLRKIEPKFLIARRGNDNTVFLPLVLDRGGWKDAWQRAILPAGHCEFDLHDPIAVGPMDDACWRSFWPEFEAELLARWRGTFDVASIGRVRGDALPGESRGEPVDVVPWMSLEGIDSREALLGGSSRKKLRNSVNASIRRMEQGGGVRLHVHDFGEAVEIEAAVGRFARVHAAKWPDAATPYEYYKNLASRGVAAGLVCVSELYRGDKPVSWRIQLRHKRTMAFYVQAYLEEEAAYSPGTLQCCMLLEEACLQGLVVADFGRGTEKWKHVWTETTYPLYSRQWVGRGIRSLGTRMWQGSVRPHVVNAKRRLLGRKAKFVSD